MTEISTPKYKHYSNKDNSHYINDGMNELERNIKRLIDLFMHRDILSPILILLLRHQTRGRWSCHFQAGTHRTFRASLLYL